MAGTAPTLRASHAASIAAPTISSVPPRRIRPRAGARFRGFGRRGVEREQRRHHRQHDQQLLGALAAEPDDQQQAGGERADDRADGVGGVDAADQPRRILAAVGDRRERERKAGAPEDRGRQHRPQRAHQIELEREPRAARRRRIDRPVRAATASACTPTRRSRRPAASAPRPAPGAAAPCCAPAPSRRCCRCRDRSRNTARISEKV